MMFLDIDSKTICRRHLRLSDPNTVVQVDIVADKLRRSFPTEREEHQHKFYVTGMHQILLLLCSLHFCRHDLTVCACHWQAWTV